MVLHRAYLGLGSNLGDRAQALRQAVLHLSRVVRVDACSPVFETSPLGESCHHYLNAVVQVSSALTPDALLAAMLEIERQMGRIRRQRWEDRVIDLDLLLYGEHVQQTPHCTLPHPGLHLRGFVLVPLLTLAPDLQVPGFDGLSVRELHDRLRASQPAEQVVWHSDLLANSLADLLADSSADSDRSFDARHEAD